VSRLLGIDYGSRRIGFAVSDSLGIIATPLRVAEVKSDKDALQAVRDAVRETGAEGIVVGLPLNMNGTHSDSTRSAEAFMQVLRTTLALPVYPWDERMTTMEAERVLLAADVSREKRKMVRDKMAAQIMLQSYLESQATS
jgi:putative Holliday junction resolvase